MILAFVDADDIRRSPSALAAVKAAVAAALAVDEALVYDVVASWCPRTQAAQRILMHRPWHTPSPTFTPNPSTPPTPNPSAWPTTMWAPSRAPTQNPTDYPNATRLDFVVGPIVHQDQETGAAAADAFLTEAVSDLSRSLRKGTFATTLRGYDANASLLFAGAVALANQTADVLAAEAGYSLTVTTSAPSATPTALPTKGPPPPPTQWYEDAGLCCQPHMILNSCLLFVCLCVFVWLSKKCWKEYKHDVKKIYAEGPFYRRVGAAAVRDVAIEGVLLPGYVRDAAKEWWKMIVQPNEIDARPWPGRVASERRVCENGHLAG